MQEQKLSKIAERIFAERWHCNNKSYSTKRRPQSKTKKIRENQKGNDKKMKMKIHPKGSRNSNRNLYAVQYATQRCTLLHDWLYVSPYIVYTHHINQLRRTHLFGALCLL